MCKSEHCEIQIATIRSELKERSKPRVGKEPTGSARSGRPDDKLRAVPTLLFTEADQQVSATVGERKRAEKRSTFDLEPPMAGHRSFPKRFDGRGVARLASQLRCNTLRRGFTEYSACCHSIVIRQGSAPCRV